MHPDIKGLHNHVCIRTYVRMCVLQSEEEEEEKLLIHRATMFGEINTIIDLVEEKNVDPCMTNKVS